jgi:hypothetical protein
MVANRTWLFLAVIMSLLARTGQANACLSLNRYSATTSPPANDSQVPINASVVVLLDTDVDSGASAAGFDLQESLADGGFVSTPIEATQLPHSTPFRSAFALRPIAPLKPNQAYRVVDNLSVDDPIMLSFTTGSSTDLAPPQLSSVTAKLDDEELNDSCTQSRTRYVSFDGLDAGEPTTYVVAEDGGTIASGEVLLKARYLCEGTIVAPGATAWVISPGPHLLEFRTVDRAGNSSLPVTVAFNADCNPRDAGSAFQDASAPPSNTGSDGGDSGIAMPLPSPRESDGCAASVTTPRGALAGVVTTALCAFGVARRRRRRSAE